MYVRRQNQSRTTTISATSTAAPIIASNNISTSLQRHLEKRHLRPWPSLNALFDLVFQITIAGLDFTTRLLNVSFLFQILIARCLAYGFLRLALFFIDAALNLIPYSSALLY